MDFSQLSNIFTNKDLFAFVFKILAIILSVFYLFYAIVVLKQTQVMNKALEVQGNKIFFIVAGLQIIVALVIIFLAIFLI